MFPLITGLTAHIFRHNYCSNLCYKVPEISIKKIAQLMGDTRKFLGSILQTKSAYAIMPIGKKRWLQHMYT